MDNQEQMYKEGFHDGMVSLIQDLLKEGDPEDPIKLLERIDYWGEKLKEAEV